MTTTLSSLPFCSPIATRNVSLPAHVVRRLAVVAKIPARWMDRHGRLVVSYRPSAWSESESHRAGLVLAAALRQQAPLRPHSSNGELADWISFRALARKLGCDSMVRAWDVWQSEMTWKQKCASLSEPVK